MHSKSSTSSPVSHGRAAANYGGANGISLLQSAQRKRKEERLLPGLSIDGYSETGGETAAFNAVTGKLAIQKKEEQKPVIKQSTAGVLQRLAVGGEPVLNVDTRTEHDEIKAIWRRWIGNDSVAFHSWAEAEKYAALVIEVTRAGSPLKEAEAIHNVLRTDGSARYLAQVKAGEAGGEAHHVIVKRMILAGTFRNVEQYMESAFGFTGRYLDVVGQQGAHVLHTESKDFALSYVADEGRQKEFASQLMDNLIWACSAPGRIQRYVFAKGIPLWAHKIMQARFNAYAGDFPGFQTNLNTFPAYNVQIGNGPAAEVDFQMAPAAAAAAPVPAAPVALAAPSPSVASAPSPSFSSPAPSVSTAAPAPSLSPAAPVPAPAAASAMDFTMDSAESLLQELKTLYLKSYSQDVGWYGDREDQRDANRIASRLEKEFGMTSAAIMKAIGRE